MDRNSMRRVVATVLVLVLFIVVSEVAQANDMGTDLRIPHRLPLLGRRHKHKDHIPASSSELPPQNFSQCYRDCFERNCKGITSVFEKKPCCALCHTKCAMLFGPWSFCLTDVMSTDWKCTSIFMLGHDFLSALLSNSLCVYLYVLFLCVMLPTTVVSVLFATSFGKLETLVSCL